MTSKDDVDPRLLLLFYASIVLPILLYRPICFFNMLPVTNQIKLICITNTAAKIITVFYCEIQYCEKEMY